MSVSRFFRLYLWVPLVLPVLIWAAGHYPYVGQSGEKYGGPDKSGGIVHITAEPITISNGVAWVGSTLIASLVVGGVPYFALALWARRRARGCTDASIRRLALRMPLLMAPLFIPCVLAFALVTEPSEFFSRPDTVLTSGPPLITGTIRAVISHSPLEMIFAIAGWSGIFAIYTLVIGYSYVALGFALVWAGRRFGWLVTSSGDGGRLAEIHQRIPDEAV